MSGEHAPTEAHQDVMRCLRGRLDAAAAAAARRRAGAGFDWPRLWRIAAAHRVAPLVYHVLRDAAGVPPAALAPGRLEYQRTAARNLFVLHRLERALRALAAARVEPIVLKGAALATTLYRNIALRPLADVDLLIHPDERDAAFAALGALGYRAPRAETHPGVLTRFENELVLRSEEPGDVDLDIHWTLFDSPHYQGQEDAAWWWHSAGPLPIRDAVARRLGTEAELLHLCGHLALHHQGTGLLWMQDVAELLAARRDAIDWPLLLERARALDLIMPLQQLLPRAAAEWGAPVPEDALAALAALRPSGAEDRIAVRLSRPRRSPARRLWDDLAATRSWRDRLAFARTNLFPSPRYMRERYGVSRGVLLPFYYPYRWWKGLFGG